MPTFTNNKSLTLDQSECNGDTAVAVVKEKFRDTPGAFPGSLDKGCHALSILIEAQGYNHLHQNLVQLRPTVSLLSCFAPYSLPTQYMGRRFRFITASTLTRSDLIV